MFTMDLQRIVDGELNHQQRAELLQSLGDDSGQWRALALALLEEQQWAREIRADALTAAVTSPVSLQSSAIELANKNVSAGRTASGRIASLGSMNWFTALAASAMLCIGITGGMAYRASQTPIPEVDLAKAAGANNSGHTNGDSLRFRLPGPNASQAEVPLLDVSEIDPNLVLANDAFEIARLNQELRRKGYRLDVQPQIYSGRLNDGRQVVVPIHNVALKSVGL